MGGTHIYIYIERERERDWVQVTPSVNLTNITPLNIFQLNANIEKSTIRLHYLRIFFMLVKFRGDQRLIIISSINC